MFRNTETRTFGRRDCSFEFEANLWTLFIEYIFYMKTTRICNPVTWLAFVSYEWRWKIIGRSRSVAQNSHSFATFFRVTQHTFCLEP